MVHPPAPELAPRKTPSSELPTTPMNIILGVTASIAAYKAADIASKLTKQDRSVHVVMTAGATQFITPLTLQTLSRHPVTTNISDEKMSWHPEHIDLSDNADLVLIARTADILAKLAHGFVDDALTSPRRLQTSTSSDNATPFSSARKRAC